MTVVPVCVGTWPFSVPAVAEARRLLVDSSNVNVETALVRGVKVVEDDPNTGAYFVGRGGIPNEDGVIEMDAAVMRGKDCAVGSCLAITSQPCPSLVAHKILTDCRHSVLAGKGASDFALKQGLSLEDPGTPESAAAYDDYLKKLKSKDKQQGPELKEPITDTLGVVGVDAEGHVAAVVTTSGMSFKASGRVGDSALPGAGLYADDMGGAAAASGDGDQILRFLPCFRVVQAMIGGKSPTEACEIVLNEIRERLEKSGQPMLDIVIVAVNTAGVYGAGSSIGPWRDHVTGENYTGFPYGVSSADRTYVNVLASDPKHSTNGSVFPSM
eukprot:m.113615 g.113615  ORF g.113615 m.113615 type:complete len:327 (+) comp14138_c0_seq7:426-1406(+)